MQHFEVAGSCAVDGLGAAKAVDAPRKRPRKREEIIAAIKDTMMMWILYKLNGRAIPTSRAKSKLMQEILPCPVIFRVAFCISTLLHCIKNKEDRR